MARIGNLVLLTETERLDAFENHKRISEELNAQSAANHSAHVITAWEAVGRPWDCGYVGVSVGLMSAMDRYREQTGVGLPLSARSAH